MSIYSGFATRNQQEIYDYFVHDLIFILSKRIIKFYQNQQVDEPKFTNLLKQFFLKLTNLQKQKYLEPNLSTALYSIIEYILKKQGFNSYKDDIQFFQKKNTLWVKVQKNQSQNKSQKSLSLNNQISKNIASNKQIQSKNNSHHQKMIFMKNQTKKAQNSILKNKVKFNSTNRIQVYNPQILAYQRQKPNRVLFNQTIRLGDIKTPRKQLPRESKSNNVKNKSLKNIQQSFRKQYLYEPNYLESSSDSREDLGRIKNAHNCRQNRNNIEQNICKYCKNQRPQTKNLNSSRIKVPQLIKQYIQSTNHDYMKHFRKRKIRKPLQYP